MRAVKSINYQVIKKVIIGLLLLLAAIFLVASKYKLTHFKDSQIDEILFYFNNGIVGGKTDNFWEIAIKNLPLAILLFIIIMLPVINKTWILIKRGVDRVINMTFPKTEKAFPLIQSIIDRKSVV